MSPALLRPAHDLLWSAALVADAVGFLLSLAAIHATWAAGDRRLLVESALLALVAAGLFCAVLQWL